MEKQGKSKKIKKEVLSRV